MAQLKCRTCFEISAHFYPLTDPYESDRTLADLMLFITKIDAKDNAEHLPNHICGTCSRKLKNAYSFVQQAQRVNEQLLKVLRDEAAAASSKECLLEAPIDIPASGMQIKLEAAEIGDECLYDNFSIMEMPVSVECDVAAMSSGGEGGSSNKIKPKVTGVSLKKEDIEAMTSSNSAANASLDPITVAATYWDNDTDDDNNDNDIDDSFNIMDHHNDTDSPYVEDSDAEYQPSKVKVKAKRGRGRPRTNKYKAYDDMKATVGDTKTAGRYICAECGKTFAWKKDLQRHANTHFAAPQFQCEYCERKFLRKDKFNDHLRAHLKQSGQPPRHSEWLFAERLYTAAPFQLIQCKLCADSSFQTTQSLRQHLLQLHTDPATLLLQPDSEVMRELFPQTTNLDDLRKSISADVAQHRLARYYAVVNQFGYEMSLSDSDADAEENEHKYKCELCASTFKRKHEIFAHTKAEHADASLPHKCNVCKLEFVCDAMFELHTRTQCRSKEKLYQCLKCPGKFMWSENLERHQCSNRFNTPEYKTTVLSQKDVRQCNVCDKTFVRKKDLKRHLETHTADARDSLECEICLQRFRKPQNLRQHMKTAHERIKQCRIECRLCPEHEAKSCDKLSQLRAHLNEQHANATNEFGTESDMRHYCAVDASGNELDLYDSETDDETSDQAAMAAIYKCELCEHTTKRRKHMLQHQQSTHAVDNGGGSDGDEQKPLPHTCAVCQKQFVCAELLAQHLSRDCCNAAKTLSCEKCPARFVWPENLQLHVRLKHIDPEQRISRQLANKLQCDQCDKVFIWPKDLTRHKRVHMPEDEKYDCPFCDRKFNRKDNMHSHMKVHGKEAAESVTSATDKKKKEPHGRMKPGKVKGIDEHLCKPHGCKLIQCMICLSKHSKIADLRTHMRTHQYVVNFAQRNESIADIAATLYPEEEDTSSLTEAMLRARIIADVTAQKVERFYSITNEVGYELCMNSSETESDSDTAENADADNHDDDDDDDNDDDDDDKPLSKMQCRRHEYECDVCRASFNRKYKLFAHQERQHEWDEATHVCSHCAARFVSKALLLWHQAAQCKNVLKRYACRKCPLKFMWKDNLKMHLRMQHADVDESKKKSESSRIFECVQCNRIFQMQKDLTRHMVMHQSGEAYSFKCLWCPRKFYRKYNLHMHIHRHGVRPEHLIAARCLISATSGPNGVKQVQCKVCNLLFPSVSALRAHLLQAPAAHHQFNSPLNYSITNALGFELQIDDSETETEVQVKKEATAAVNAYRCEMCNLTCRRKFEVAQHQRSMHKHELLPLKCEKCIFRTVSKEILAHHMRTQCYNPEKLFQCKRCCFKFMWQENLDMHMRLQHAQDDEEDAAAADVEMEPKADTAAAAEQAAAANAASTCLATAEKIFQCDKCNRKYNRKDRLTAHIKKAHNDNAGAIVTTGGGGSNDASQIDPATGEMLKKPPLERKFLCAFCGRGLTSSSNLIIHMRRHTGEKPFKCEFCDMGFPRSSDLACHRRTHTGEKPHQCTVCSRAFSRSYKLQTHMRIHSGERPYKCTYCEKSFTQSNDLTLHVRRHTGERPYVCGICGERFIQGTALKNHRTMRGHYEDEGPRRYAGMLEQF